MSRVQEVSVWVALVLLLGSCSASEEQILTKTATAPNSIGSIGTTGTAGGLTKQQRCLALAMYWEAKGEGRAGMQAVGHVVVNRVAHSGFPGTLCGVTQEGGEIPPCQFSWWCDGRSDTPVEPEPWATAQQLAKALPNHSLKDITRGAIFFHAARIKVPWKKKRTRTATIGRHIFYK